MPNQLLICHQRPGICNPFCIAVMAHVIARIHLPHAHAEKQAEKPKFYVVQDLIQRQRSESGNSGNALLASDLHLVLWSACLDGGLLGSPDAFWGFADKDDSGIVSLTEFSLAVQASVGQQVLGTEWESIPEASLQKVLRTLFVEMGAVGSKATRKDFLTARRMHEDQWNEMWQLSQSRESSTEHRQTASERNEATPGEL